MKKFVITSCFLLAINILFAQRKLNVNSSLPIGVFDSGTGGLTVLNALLTMDLFNNSTGVAIADGKPDFDAEYFQYLADQSNMPYGNYAAEKKTDLLKEHILKNIDFLISNKYSINTNANSWITKEKPPVKLIVVACNTATAYALPEMKFYLNKKATNTACIGVIDAGAKAALQWQKKHGEGLIGVFATVGTVASNGYPRTIMALAKTMGIKAPAVFSHGGLGLAESIDRDWDYFVDTLQQTRITYKGPSVKNKNYTIDTTLLHVYKFNNSANGLLCEYDDNGSCLDIQLNNPSNYVRYHLVSLLEGLLKNKARKKMNTLILGCTHYPFMKDSIRAVLKEMYQYKNNGKYRYRSVITANVQLIDPSVETAKEAYQLLRKMHLANTGIKKDLQFFISVPNTNLQEIQLQPDGWFTYQYKYGRVVGENKEYVKIVPFDQKNISIATYNRFKEALPKVYKEIVQAKK